MVYWYGMDQEQGLTMRLLGGMGWSERWNGILLCYGTHTYTYAHTQTHTQRHTHAHRHGHTDKYTHRHIDTDKDTYRHRHTVTQTHRNTHTQTHISISIIYLTDGRGGWGELLSSMPGCVCRKVKEIGPFSASRE